MASSENNKKPRRHVIGEKRRVNLRMEEDLAEWAFAYAEQNSTSVTQLITDFFMGLQRQEVERMARDAEQI